jgi:hypothetical protein
MRKRQLALIAGSAMLCALSGAAQPVGQWDFNNGDLSDTVGGLPLTFLDQAAQDATSFGTTTSFAIPDIDGTAAKVMKIPGFLEPSGIYMPVNSDANGLGGLVNNWTLVVDVLYPAASDHTFRAIIETDLGVIEADADFFVGPNNGIGINQIYQGTVTPNEWHRIVLAVNNDFPASGIRKYIDGVLVGIQDEGGSPDSGDDARWALSPQGIAYLFSDDDVDFGPAYVNSIQLWNRTLSTGEIEALGKPAAAGIPQNPANVPASIDIDNTTPVMGSSGVGYQPDINVVLNTGDSTVPQSSLKLLLNKNPVAATITPNGGSYTLDFPVTDSLEPASVQEVGVVYSENGTLKTNSFTFTVQNYVKVNLTATPLYLEDFEEVAEGGIPEGWVRTNRTEVVADHDFEDINDLKSDSYLDWTVASRDLLSSLKGSLLNIGTIVLNDQVVTDLGEGNMMYAETDSRSGSQLQVVTTKDYDLSGKANIYLSFDSFYEQNQNNLNAVEYSIDQGQTWEPLLYMLTEFNDTSDVVRNPDGTADAVATFNAPQTDTAYKLSYGEFIGAEVSQDLAPYISGRVNDDDRESKRIELLRAIKADNQPNVRFRFIQAAHASWYWGIDNVGIYSLPEARVVFPLPNPILNYGDNYTFNVVASGESPITYQWLFNGSPIPGATSSSFALTSVTAENTGTYSVTVMNSAGQQTSKGGNMTVVLAPNITTQPQDVLTSEGGAVNLSVAANGQAPFTYQWQLNSNNIAGATSATYSIPSGAVANSGDYRVVITNPSGTATSRNATVLVSASAITEDLVVHLALDGNPDDSSGRGNNGSLVGNPGFEAGKIGQAIRVNVAKDSSAFDYLTLGYPDDLKFLDNVDFSISFWINYTNSEDDPALISNKNWNSSGNRGWGIFSQGGGNTRINVTGDSDKMDTSNTPVIGDGNWHNEVVVFWRGRWTFIYVDGVLVKQTPLLTPGSVDTDISNGYSVNIGEDGTGSYTDGGSADLNALIDDVGFWRRVLTPQEAASIFAEGSQGNDLTKATGAGGTPTEIGSIATVLSGGQLTLNWTGGAGITLQSTPTLTNPNWQDVTGTTGASTANVQTTGTAFYRLIAR